MKQNAACNLAPRQPRSHWLARSRALPGALVLGLALAGTSVRATSTRTWNGGGTDNNWGTSANWGSTGTPITDDSLVFQGTARLTPFNNIGNSTLSRIGTLSISATGFTISGNPLQLGGNWTIGYDASWAINSTLSQNISFTHSRAGKTLTFSGTLNNDINTLTLLGAGNFTFTGAISGSGGLNINESGTASLATANSYSGLTTIAAGTLKLGVANAIPRLTGYSNNYISCSGAGGTLNLNGYALACNALIGYGTVTSSSGNPVLTLGSSEPAYDGLGFSGPIMGSLALTKDGTNLFYLDGASAYSGDTTISAGTLQMRATECLPYGPGTGNLIVNAGAILDLRGSDTQVNGLAGAGKVSNNSDATAALFTVGNNDATSTFSGVIDDSQTAYEIALTKVGAGTLALSGANNFRGATEVSAGILAVNGSLVAASAVTVDTAATLSGSGTAAGTVQVDGIVAPGNGVGALNTGAETWDAGGSYAFQMGSATGTAGTNWDLLRITGNLNVAATIGSAFTVTVSSLSNGVAGPAANFDNTQDYEWPIATVTGSILNFDPTKFILDVSRFQNDTGSGQFGIKLSSNQKSVDLVFTHTCEMNLTTSTYTIGADGNVHMYFSNPFGMLNTVAVAVNNCTIMAGTAYGAGFQSGVALSGLPLTFVGASTSLPAGSTRLELVAAKVITTQTAVVNVLVNDACGGKGGFDPVVTLLEVQQGGVARQSFSNIASADRYVRVINGTPGLQWLCLSVNGQLFVLSPLTDGEDVMVDIGAALAEGDANVITVCGQGVAGASAAITIGDTLSDNLVTPLTPTGSDAQYWSSLANAGVNPVLQVTCGGGNIILAWPDLWDGFNLQTRASLAPSESWVPLGQTPLLTNGQFTVTVPASSGALFRLYQP